MNIRGSRNAFKSKKEVKTGPPFHSSKNKSIQKDEKGKTIRGRAEGEHRRVGSDSPSPTFHHQLFTTRKSLSSSRPAITQILFCKHEWRQVSQCVPRVSHGCRLSKSLREDAPTNTIFASSPHTKHRRLGQRVRRLLVAIDQQKKRKRKNPTHADSIRNGSSAFGH